MAEPKLKYTGNCYEAAAELLVDPFNKDYADWTLVHGEATLRIAPYIRFGHAWLEKDDVAYDPDAGKRMPVLVYYALGQISTESLRRYNRLEARRIICEHGHWGPWDD